jgi:hypothetical protein
VNDDGGLVVRRNAVLRAHSIDLLTAALNSHQNVRDAVRDDPRERPAQVLATIVMSCAAASAQIAEFGQDGMLRGFTFPTSVLAASRRVREEPEGRGRVLRQYIAAADALGSPLDRGRAPLQDAGCLFTLRNAMIHTSPLETVDERTGELTMPGPVRWLAHRGWLAEPDERDGDAPPSWMQLIRTVAVSEWAFRSAVALMRHHKRALPEGPCGPDPELLRLMRGQLDAADP